MLDHCKAIAVRAKLDPTAESRARVGALRVDQAAQGICAVACTLRAAQHIDLVHVEERCSPAQAAEIDVIDQETDGRIGRPLVLFELTDSADLKIARPRSIAGPIKIGHESRHILEILLACVLQKLGVEHGDRRWDLKRRNGPQGRRHDDLLQGRTRLGRERLAEAESGERNARKSLKIDRVNGESHNYLLPTPVLTGSGSTGLPVPPASQVLVRTTPRFDRRYGMQRHL